MSIDDESESRGKIDTCYCGREGNVLYVVGAIRKDDRPYDAFFCCEEHKYVWQSLGDRRAVQEGRLELITEDVLRIAQVAKRFHKK